MRMIRLWKHLTLLKRGGIGMNPGGVDAACKGSCVVECPACPRDVPSVGGAAGPSAAGNDDNDNDPPPPLLLE